MKSITKILVVLFLITLTACAPGAQYTFSPATFTPIPVPSTLPGIFSTAQKIYLNPNMGIQFSYPESWYLQELPSGQPSIVTVTSFDPAFPPHKLEWTDQTASIQFSFMVLLNPPDSFDAWVESAKQTALANQLSIFAEERFLIANQPAAHLSLVSGSGGVIHQVLTILNGRYYEINIEAANFNLAKTVLDTVQPVSSGELRPPDSDTPADGICGDAQGNPVNIILGKDPGCVAVNPTQRIRIINQSNGPFGVKFAEYYIFLPVGGETLLDKPVGEYLALGVHFLPVGPKLELWVKAMTPIPTFTPIPVPTTSSRGLKPPDSDSPASGICAESQGEIVEFTLTSDGPAMPRCAKVIGAQRIKLINATGAVVQVNLAHFNMSIPVDSSVLLDQRVDEYLAPGVHWVNGAEVWVIANSPPPITAYSNSEVGYRLSLPGDWSINESGMTNGANKEVIFSPPYTTDPNVIYLSISLDFRTLDQIINFYAQNVPDATREDVNFYGYLGIKYTYTYGRNEYFIPYEGQIFLIATDRPNDGTIQLMLMSIHFMTPTVMEFSCLI